LTSRISPQSASPISIAASRISARIDPSISRHEGCIQFSQVVTCRTRLSENRTAKLRCFCDSIMRLNLVRT
jgi:hypothetical protein